MITFGPPLTERATRLILLGSGELGREVAIEAMRLGCEVVAVDRYPNAPAMQIAHRSEVVPMTEPGALRALLEAERARPCAHLMVVPELEAIATPVLQELEADGLHVVPTARAARLTMDREGIRRLAAEELGLPTSPYRFCDSAEELEAAVEALGAPCVVKPVMSSSGKGQSVVDALHGARVAWDYAQQAGRTSAGRVIAEGFVEFDYEITLLTVRHGAAGGIATQTAYCRPIGHVQESGDYRESWQPRPMEDGVLAESRRIAHEVTAALGGTGLFGVELFVRGHDVLFSEVSPRPHDTGMVTMATQRLSEFALHVRAILGLPIPTDRDGFVPTTTPGASAVLLGSEDNPAPVIGGVAAAMAVAPNVDVRLFGKPDARAGRRMGVALAGGADAETARRVARTAAAQLRVD